MSELPVEYLNQMRNLLGQAGFLSYIDEMKKPYWRGIRFNPQKYSEDQDPLQMADGVGEHVPWAKNSYYLSNDSIAGSSIFHEAGAYYIQEPSAMSVVTVLDPKPGEKILDLCAAPGGKSTQAAGLMEGKGLIVCNEPVYSRAQILSRNIERMGICNSLVISYKPEQLVKHFGDFFDKIIVDAPCSGEGMFRRHPESILEWKENSPAVCAERQKDILNSASLMVRRGGVIVYSTCTFNNTENEGVISWFLESHPEFETDPFVLEGIGAAEKGYLHLYPHEIRGEGHFICRLIRKGISDSLPDCRSEKNKNEKVQIPDLSSVFKNIDVDKLLIEQDKILLVNEEMRTTRINHLRYLRKGLQIAHAKGKVFEPDHAAVMGMKESKIRNIVDISQSQARQFIYGEQIICSNKIKGWTALRYGHLLIGWGKISEGMIKNHYPKGLRKRTD